MFMVCCSRLCRRKCSRQEATKPYNGIGNCETVKIMFLFVQKEWKCKWVITLF